MFKFLIVCAGILGFNGLVDDVAALLDKYAVGEANGCLFSKIAISINNSTDRSVKYFYSSLSYDDQTRWYQHVLKPHTSTWDWTWSNGLSYWNCIEFEQSFSDNTSKYIVIVNQGIYEEQLMSESLYSFIGRSDINPSWHLPIWNKTFLPISWYDGWNYHCKITFNVS